MNRIIDTWLWNYGIAMLIPATFVIWLMLLVRFSPLVETIVVLVELIVLVFSMRAVWLVSKYPTWGSFLERRK